MGDPQNQSFQDFHGLLWMIGTPNFSAMASPLRCLFHEGLDLADLVLQSRKQIAERQERNLAIHLEAGWC